MTSWQSTLLKWEGVINQSIPITRPQKLVINFFFQDTNFKKKNYH